MEVWLCIIYFFVGACFISCGNCIYYRVINGEDWVRGRSHCDGCGRQLRIWELVPVFSCVFLRGRCSRCGYPFGYRHAETEMMGGLLAPLCCIGLDGIEMQVTRLAIFGIIYCGLSWISAQDAK